MALSKPDQGYMAAPKDIKVNDYMRFGERVHRIHKIIAHRFRMGDVEDPDLLVADPIWRWQQSDAGKFIMENAIEQPYWIRINDYTSYQIKYRIMARLSDQIQTFWKLKWG